MIKKPEDNALYIICECATDPNDISSEILNESSVVDSDGLEKPYVTIDTTLQSFDVENWNTRIYGGNLVMDSINNDGMIQNDIKHGQWIGEYGHPLDATPKRQMIIYPPLASHRILNYRREGNLLKGHVQTLADGEGLKMCNRIKQGIPASFSLRSLGKVDMATRRVMAPLKVITYDSVFRPSHIEAYQDSILSEAVEFNTTGSIMNESTMIVPINESIEQILSYTKDKSDNLKRVAEMFKLDKLECTLTENCNNVSVKVDKDTTVIVPIESIINAQYTDMLKSIER